MQQALEAAEQRTMLRVSVECPDTRFRFRRDAVTSREPAVEAVMGSRCGATPRSRARRGPERGRAQGDGPLRSR